MTAQKRISAPRTYNIKRKAHKWITCVNPGPHNKKAPALNIILRDIINITRNSKEVKNALNKGKVLVDGRVRKDYKFPVGFMDVISIPLMKKDYRVTYDHVGKFKCISISKKESSLKIVRIKNKSRKGKGYHLTMNDGRI